MPATNLFFDTNVLLYLLSNDSSKADRATNLIKNGGNISVQVLNELAAVCLRKLKMPYPEVRDLLWTIQKFCLVHPLTTHVNALGLELCERYQLGFYDALIVASALEADCKTLFSEDMQNGQVINQKLRIKNPFKS
ncbi:MAG: PIN domain-containing protein [Burkholderiaceae bacterium]